ncbi:SUMO1 sentrin specific peptidase 8, variant 2 [Balamuthia mandrillaris]
MFMISFTDDINELRELLSPLKLTERRMVFMPINNHNSIETAGGSHWSLLVYNRDSNQLHYYDSLRSHNIAAARKTARKMAPLLLQEGEGEEEPAFVVASSPQQINSSDCGLYVCALSEYIGKQFQQKQQQQQQSGEGESETSSVTRSNSNGKTLEQEVTPTNVSAKRKQMKELILQLKIKQEEKKKGGAGGIFSLRRGKRKEQQT